MQFALEIIILFYVDKCCAKNSGEQFIGSTEWIETTL